VDNNIEIIENKIYIIRNISIMLDNDLAQLYGVETKRINEAVKNNIEKFPDDFMFELNDDEYENLKSKISTSSWGGRRTKPKVFTEQGVYMLATILKSKTATDVTISIMRTFTKMRDFLNSNASIFQRFERIEQRVNLQDDKIEKVFRALEDKTIKPSQGIFYNGEIFDAYKFISDLIKNSKEEIILLDNYIDETVLTLFGKNQDIKVTIYTKTITKQLKLDLEKYNSQYNNIEIKKFNNSHDRFMVIDKKEVYHIGASLKDLGKKWFAFSKMDISSIGILDRLEGV